MVKKKDKTKSGESDGEEELDMEIGGVMSPGEATGEVAKSKNEWKGRCPRPECNSTQGYVQVTTGAWICRKCGKATLVDGKVVDARELLLKRR